jgi:hypothetical protein
VNLRLWTIAALLAVSGCGNGDQDPRANHLGSSVTGYLLVVPDQPVRVCEALKGSPPQICEGESTVVTGLDPDDVNELQASGELQWTTKPVTLYGDLSDRQLTVPVRPRGPAVIGQVHAGPTCPGQLSPTPDPSCAPITVADAPITIRNANGSVVTRLVTDVTGRFAVALTPGTYRIEPGRVETFLGQADPTTVTIHDTPVEIQLMYDTGIR